MRSLLAYLAGIAVALGVGFVLLLFFWGTHLQSPGALVGALFVFAPALIFGALLRLLPTPRSATRYFLVMAPITAFCVPVLIFAESLDRVGANIVVSGLLAIAAGAGLGLFGPNILGIHRSHQSVAK